MDGRLEGAVGLYSVGRLATELVGTHDEDICAYKGGYVSGEALVRSVQMVVRHACRRLGDYRPVAAVPTVDAAMKGVLACE